MPRSTAEEVAGLKSAFEQFEKYEHDRWHKLANDLTPLFNLPREITRDIGRLEGTLKEMISAAVEKAVEPLQNDISELREEVDALKRDKHHIIGAKMVLIWLGQTVAAVITTLLAVATFWKQP